MHAEARVTQAEPTPEQALQALVPHLGKAKELDGRTLEIVRHRFREAKRVDFAGDEPVPYRCVVCSQTVDDRQVAIEVPGARSEILPGRVVHLVLAHDFWHPNLTPFTRPPLPPPEEARRTRRPKAAPAEDPPVSARSGELPFVEAAEDFPEDLRIDPREIWGASPRSGEERSAGRSRPTPARGSTAPRPEVPPRRRQDLPRGRTSGRVEIEDRRSVPDRRGAAPSERRERQEQERQLPALRGSGPPPEPEQKGTYWNELSEWFWGLFSSSSPPGVSSEVQGHGPAGRWICPPDVEAILVDPSGREWGPGLVPAGEYELLVLGRPPSRVRIEANRSYRASKIGRLFDVLDGP